MNEYQASIVAKDLNTEFAEFQLQRVADMELEEGQYEQDEEEEEEEGPDYGPSDKGKASA